MKNGTCFSVNEDASDVTCLQARYGNGDGTMAVWQNRQVEISRE
jgi:hypothetical protein